MRDTKSIHRQPKTSGTFKPITQAHSGTFGHIRAHSVTLWKFRCSKRQRGGAHSVQPITPCIILIRVHSRGAPRRVGDPSRILCTCVRGPLQLRASHLLLLLLLFPPMDRPADRPATRPTERPTDRRIEGATVAATDLSTDRPTDRWTVFTRKEHKSVKKCKILGFTAANGRVLCVRCPAPWNSSKFAVLVRKHVGPFFRRAFPERRLIRILIDSERLLHTDEAKRAFAEFGICPMAGWPKYSPDMNPQENVWSWTEKALRREEQKSDTFPTFCRKLLRVARRYPSPECLIPSMAKRVKRVLKHGGAMTKY